MNHKEVHQTAERLGFEVVALDGMPFIEQVRLFASAGIVAGPHGAGFANMAFAPEGCVLVELMGPRVNQAYGPTQFYGRLASLLKPPYRRVVGNAVEAEKTDPLHVSTERYRIEPAGMMRVLREVLAGA